MQLTPRVKAALCVLLLIGGWVLGVVGVVNSVGPALAHDTKSDHVAGKITRIVGGMNFQFKTSNGKILTFQCTTKCRASLGHMQRHINEKATTDVYYIKDDDVFLARDVD